MLKVSVLKVSVFSDQSSVFSIQCSVLKVLVFSVKGFSVKC